MPVDSKELRAHEWRNRLQTMALVGGLLVIAALIGWTIAGTTGLVLLAGGALFFLGIGQKVGPAITLRAFNAKPVNSEDAPQLVAVVAELARRAKLKVGPTLYYVPSQLPNAFATGSQKDPAIAVTDGILRALDMRELTGVLAHEMSHLKNKDMAVMGLADLASRTAHIAARIGHLLLLINLPLVMTGGKGIPWLLVIILIGTPTLTSLLQLALSRTREFDADADAARLTGDPEGLALALRKLEQGRPGGLMEKILLPGRRLPQPSLLRTHPTTEERVKRLYAYGGLEYQEPPAEARLTPEQVILRLPAPPTRRPRWHFFSGVWS